MSEDKSIDTWAKVGKILTVLVAAVGLVAGIIQVSDRLFGGDGMEAVADYSRFMLPETYNKEFEKREKLSAEVDKWIGSVKSLSKSQQDEVTTQVSKHILEAYPKNVFRQLGGYSFRNEVWFYKYIIKNSGKKEVTGLRMDFQVDRVTEPQGIYRLVRPTEPLKFDEFKKTIDLGSLLPSQELSLMIWLGEDITSGWQNETRVIHPNGVLVVEYPIKATGPVAWIYNLGLFVFILAVPVILIIVFFIFLSIKPKSPNKDKEKEPTEPTVADPAAASVPAEPKTEVEEH